MSDTLIAQIRAARQLLRQEEERTHDAAVELQNCRKREKSARGELDALLDTLEKGVDSRYPLFPEQPQANGNGQAAGGQVVPATAADETPVRIEPPLRGRGRRK